MALCDSRTVKAKDLVAADRVRREFIGEGLWALESRDYKWYWLPQQHTDEVTFIKVADSRDDVTAKRKYNYFTARFIG